MIRTMTAALATVAAAAALLASPVARAQYVITKIADTSGAFGSPVVPGQPTSPAFGPPAINNAGDVAFWAALDDGTTGIFRARGDAITRLANSAADNLALNEVFVDINAAGTVVFSADGPQFGVYTATGAAPLARQTRTTGTVTIADSGAVYVVNGIDNVYEGRNGVERPLLPGGYASVNAVDVTPDGSTVVFTAQRSGAGHIYRVSPSSGLVTEAANTAGPLSSLSSPGVNEGGTVAFVGLRDAGGRGIYTADGDGSVSPVVTTDGPFDLMSFPSINATGRVAFFSALDDGRQGLFAGPDPSADQVILRGDSLFGSTVTGLQPYHTSLNDAGQIAFFYRLMSGESGIAIATPVPEPQTVFVVLPIAAAVVVRRQRRRVVIGHCPV